MEYKKEKFWIVTDDECTKCDAETLRDMSLTLLRNYMAQYNYKFRKTHKKAFIQELINEKSIDAGYEARYISSVVVSSFIIYHQNIGHKPNKRNTEYLKFTIKKHLEKYI